MRNTHDGVYAKSSATFVHIYIYISQETIDAVRRATKENGATSSGADDASAGGGALLRKMVGASAAVGQEEGAGGKGLSSRMVLSDDEVLHQVMGCVRACACAWVHPVLLVGRHVSLDDIDDREGRQRSCSSTLFFVVVVRIRRGCTFCFWAEGDNV